MKCGLCKNQPIWGCKLFGCASEGCFIICPLCGRKGFAAPEDGFIPDEQLAQLLAEATGRVITT